MTPPTHPTFRESQSPDRPVEYMPAPFDFRDPTVVRIRFEL